MPPNPLAPAPDPVPPGPHPADNLRAQALADACQSLGIDQADPANRLLISTAMAGPLPFQIETDIAQAYSEAERERARRGDWSAAFDHRLEVAMLERAIAARMLVKGCEAAGFPVPPRAQKLADALGGFLAKDDPAPAPAQAPAPAAAPSETLRAAYKASDARAAQPRTQVENPS
jgi:hypothetical protein